MPIGLVPMFGPIAPDEAVQTSHDSIGRSEPTMRGSRIARPNMTMLGVDSERAYSSILRFTPRTEALFALSSALLLPSSVASQEAVIRAFTAVLSSLPNSDQRSPRFCKAFSKLANRPMIPPQVHALSSTENRSFFVHEKAIARERDGSLLRLMTMRLIAPVESLITSEAILRDSILG